MKIKISKKLKKLLAGATATAVIVSAILVFGNIQNPYFGISKASAESVEYLFYDLFFKVVTGKTQEHRAEEKENIASNQDPNIIIVDIDEISLEKLGNYNEWDRTNHANVVKNLSAGGASAISFDILFKNADFGQKKANQSLEILKKISPRNDWDSLYPSILANYNHDSLLISAIQESGNTIVPFLVDDKQAYKYESEWRPLSGEKRAQEVGFSSVFYNDQIDSVQNIETKDILDNVFPQLSHAGAFMGSVNMYPDDDGVVRRASLLYRFPNPYLLPTQDSSLKEVGQIDTSRVYSTMTLMTILHLFHQKPENVKIKMGQYIDIGKPFGVYRDSAGTYHTTYPQFSYPMFQALREKLSTIETNNARDFIDVSQKIIATKKEDGKILFELFEGQILSEKFSEILPTLDNDIFEKLGTQDELEIGEGLTLKKDEEDPNRYVVTDEEEDDEMTITPYVVSTVKHFADSLQNLPVDKPIHLSLDMDIHYVAEEKQWKSNIVILSDEVLHDIRRTPANVIENLAAGEEFRFGKTKRIPIDQYGRMQINYQGRYNTSKNNRYFNHISYYNVSKNRVDPGFFQGKIFILGSAAPALFDITSGPHEENYPGVLIHANIIHNILNDKYLINLREHYQQIIVILLALICLFTGLYIKSYISVAISLAMMTGYTFLAYHYFTEGIYIGVAKQVVAILFTNIAALVIQFYYETKEKRFLGNAFKQYISPELIDEMVNKEIMPTLGGEKSNITAYFTDIASFSTFSEKIGDPSRLVDLLNEYLTEMTDTLLGNKGTLDKYEGDAIIAFFGAPMPLKNHAQSACDTAVDMQDKLMKLRRKWTSEGDKWPKVVHDMHMRIGINSGDIVTGNMGSTMRKNYTMMGDAVNLAARLESAAKQYGAYIQMSEDTQKHLEEGRFIYRSLDTVRVVGKSQPVKTFELLAHTGCENEASLQKLVEIWEQARNAYLNMEWDKAISLFTECLDYEPHHPDRDPGSKTTPSHVYIKRCEAYKQNPPVAAGETWDGVFTATEK